MKITIESPKPIELKALRKSLNLTQDEAASIVHVDIRTWQKWESNDWNKNHRKMHPAFYELFLLKTKTHHL